MKSHIGDTVEIEGVAHSICAISADRIAVRDLASGTTKEIQASDFTQLATVHRPNTPGGGSLEIDVAALQYLPDELRIEAEFLARHIRELLITIDRKPESSASTLELVASKRDELAAVGYQISTRTLRRKIKTFRERGVVGLVDQRKDQDTGVHRRTDPRVVTALAEVIASQTKASTGTKLRLLELTTQLLEQRHGTGVVPLPSTRTFFRLFADLDRGRMTAGSAKTRRSLANRPDRPFAAMGVSRPGEQVQIDSTSLDVLIQLDGGLVDRPDLTIMLDVATRTLVSAVIRPGSTKSVDLIVALARALVPYDRRPGGRVETRALMTSAFERQQLMPDDDLAAYRRRQPYIFPETITTDQGKIYISEHFENACEQLGISLNVSAAYTPTDKAKVERTFQSINTGFTQYLKNYTGRGVEYRGIDAEPETLHSLVELQELLDEWIAVVWQNRPHDGLRDPLHPHRAVSPNEMFRAYRQLIPEVEIPFDESTYIGLLPVKWRTLQAYGVTIDHRTYDSDGIRALRRTKSPFPGRNGKWPIHHDPYNVQTVWIPIDGSWLPLDWNHGSATGPMAADVWEVTRQTGFFADRTLRERDIAERSRDILTRAGTGRTREALTAARSRTVNADPMRLSELKTAPPAVDAAPETEALEDDTPAMPRLRFGLLNMREEVERRP